MIRNSWLNAIIGFFLALSLLLLGYIDFYTRDVELVIFYGAIILIGAIFLKFWVAAFIAVLGAASWLIVHMTAPHITTFRFYFDIVSALAIFSITFGLSRYIVSANAALKLYEEEREMEIAIASQLQKEMFAISRPESDSYDISFRMQYLLKLGGDLITSERIGDRILLSLADISGKSLPAALFTSMLDERLRGLFRRTTDPGEILALLNAELFKRLPIAVFVSLLLMDLDERKKSVLFASAGAEPPILYRAENGVAESLAIGETPVLGAVEEIEPAIQRLALKSGDLFVAFTDGFIGKAERESSVGRLTRAIAGSATGSADDIVSSVYKEILPPGAQIDDASIVVVKAK